MAWLITLSNTINLAVGGIDGSIVILSIAYSRAIKALEGHRDRVLDLQMIDNERLLSCSADGYIHEWNLQTKQSTRCIQFKAVVLALPPRPSSYFLVGDCEGAISRFSLDTDSIQLVDLIARHQTTIDCISIIADSCIFSKSLDRNIRQWSHDCKNLILELASESFSEKCQMGINSNLLAMGTNMGGVKIFASSDFREIHEISHKKSTKPIRACAFSKKGDLIFGGDDGLVFRYSCFKPSY